jgi:hypothetical protein
MRRAACGAATDRAAGPTVPNDVYCGMQKLDRRVARGRGERAGDWSQGRGSGTGAGGGGSAGRANEKRMLVLKRFGYPRGMA